MEASPNVIQVYILMDQEAYRQHDHLLWWSCFYSLTSYFPPLLQKSYDLSSIHITFPDGAEQKFLLLSALTCEDFDRIEMLKHMRISQHTALQKTTFPYRNHSFCMRGLRISKRVWEM
ncbi:hypothetical protein Y1Q_0014675 [Alligator mississippiensis]|uniref:Uncharacterized protein n=1 Tax=Alligator mississippiensis TaxID=8496 RepID=A0A151P868_ALLMI|nr:hypothetical protein Y1Q_0014675 [Alligator mississippiensis]